MGICLTDLRKGLVKYLLGKGILMVVHPLAQGNVSGSDLRKKTMGDISRRVVSLASFKGDFAAEYTLLSCTSILCSLTND
jgi:hypothetical protein